MFLDEPTTPFSVFTNSFAIFSEFFRGFFRSSHSESSGGEDEENESDAALELNSTTTTPTSRFGFPTLRLYPRLFSQSTKSIVPLKFTTERRRLTKLESSNDLEGSGEDELVAEGFLMTIPQHSSFQDDQEKILGHETRRKPAKTKGTNKKFEYEVVEGSGV